MYCVPSIAKQDGAAVTPELVVNSHSTSPVVALKARNLRSVVPPAKTRSPAVVSTGPQSSLSSKPCDQTISPLSTSQACSWPISTGWLVSTLSWNLRLERMTSIGMPI